MLLLRLTVSVLPWSHCCACSLCLEEGRTRERGHLVSSNLLESSSVPQKVTSTPAGRLIAASARAARWGTRFGKLSALIYVGKMEGTCKKRWHHSSVVLWCVPSPVIAACGTERVRAISTWIGSSTARLPKPGRADGTQAVTEVLGEPEPPMGDPKASSTAWQCKALTSTRSLRHALCHLLRAPLASPHVLPLL